jgi:hypothetical protein
MHKTSSRLPQLAVQALTAAWLFTLTTPAGAGPIVLQEAKQSEDAVVDTSKLETLEPNDSNVGEIANWDKPTTPSGTTKAAAKPGDAQQAGTSAQTHPETNPRPESAPAAAAAQPSLAKDLHDSIKEAVRPVYDGLLESGAIESLHDVKEGLGLDKDPWNDPNKADGQPKASAQWDSPSVNGSPRTAAQAQMDRELAGMMRAKLIDQLTPWLMGLAGLFIGGYLIKLLFGFIRWKSARRNAQLIQRSRRHAARRSHGTGTRTAPSPLGAATSTKHTTSAAEETL